MQPPAPLPPPCRWPADALVCVVDDDDSIRRSLVRLLRSAGVAAVAFESADAYLVQPPPAGPSCLVLDVQMPGLDGLGLQRELADRESQIVFLTGHGDVPSCARAMRAGAVDFLTKPVEDATLLDAVARALDRATAAQSRTAARLSAETRLHTLTAREIEVMRWVIAGRLNKQIAGELGAAEKTIKIHRGRVMEKMGVASVADLVRLAQVAGVTPSA